jgi:hypothetical protein
MNSISATRAGTSLYVLVAPRVLRNCVWGYRLGGPEPLLVEPLKEAKASPETDRSSDEVGGTPGGVAHSEVNQRAAEQLRSPTRCFRCTTQVGDADVSVTCRARRSTSVHLCPCRIALPGWRLILTALNCASGRRFHRLPAIRPPAQNLISPSFAPDGALFSRVVNFF